MADIFISYAREDEARIKPLVSAFEARGWSVFWDRRIPAGETWRSYIGAALQSARCIVVAWSTHSVESQWVAEEGDEGRTRGILVPVLLDSVLPPRGFREIQAADLTDWQPGRPSARLDELLADLARRLGGSPTAGRPVPAPPQSHPATPAAPPSTAASASSPLTKWIALAALGIAVAGLGWWGLRTARVDSPPVREVPAEPRPQVPPEPAAEPGWCVVAGSFPRRDLEAAERRQLQMRRADLPVQLLDSNEYPMLTADLWVVCVGFFGSREAAGGALERVRAFVPDAYVKRAR